MTNEILGPRSGIVIAREDPDNNDPDEYVVGRIKARIPGLIDETAWAWPRGFGGAEKWGINRVPPIDSEVIITFVNGDPDHPLWEPGHHGLGKTFPEFDHPDMIVMGTDSFRFVCDPREGQRYASLKAIKEVNGQEETLIELRFDIERNMVLLHGETGLALSTLGQLEIKSRGGDVEIQKRKVVKTTRTI